MAAKCKHCGYTDESLPDWENWECEYCVRDEQNGVNGSYTPKERSMLNFLRDGNNRIIGEREVR
ncbi:MAG: hypothetical protein KAS32_10620 [Candidatus Peribacteraceae bacterium]|nr:hypothetical protein [Candidatus Peribacteraceae bacterium]